jgi:4-aminobutyrate aminotransferase-like enzyme
LTACLDHADPALRPALERRLVRYDEMVSPALDSLPTQVIHGDVHAGNLVVDPVDHDLVIGIIDFGDCVMGGRVQDVAIAAGYQLFGSDPVDALVETVVAAHAIDPLTATELSLIPDLAISRLVQSYLITAWRAAIHPDNRDYILADAASGAAVIADFEAISAADIVEALLDACGMSVPGRWSSDDALRLRRSLLGPALSLSYQAPVRLDSGEGVWLRSTDGERLLDAYNNVPHVGHAHPQVSTAIADQARRLTTNTRYVVDSVTAYAARIVELMPGDLSVVMFVNSGSEANDLAIQIARAVTGARGVITSEHAYHGTTLATGFISPEEVDVAVPWSARVGGETTLVDVQAATMVVQELNAAFGGLAEAGERPAMLIFDDVFSSDGIHRVPPGYLRSAYAAARKVGALCVADEVQAGFGRVGAPFWGFAQDDVVPDIVTLGKPMGNGFPMGAVVTTAEIAARFAERSHFFSTFAGSPVAAAAGNAVLDVLQREDLPARADEVGEHLRVGLSALQHPAIVSVRGPGCGSSSPFLAIPWGQWAINGVEMPPSWTKCLYSRNGVLDTLAQLMPYAIYVSSGPGMTFGPIKVGTPARFCLGTTSSRITLLAIGGRVAATGRFQSPPRPLPSWQPPLSWRNRMSVFS